MSHRIRQLEDALAILNSSVSSGPHPLLVDNLLKIKFGPEVERSSVSPPPDRPVSGLRDPEKATKETLDALGTLTLSSDGEMKFFGRSAGSQVCLTA
jgi:hypothetical protein